MTVRSEPKVIEAFSKLWGTDKLLVSFDGMNLTIPATDRPASEPWPHVDQSPLRKGMQCVQGILNFARNGPHDGGLIVVKGSSKLNEQFFKSHDVHGRKTWGPADWFGFEQKEVDWFLERGCEVVKVCAEPGDLILWDSRTVHWNVMPESQVTRAVMCKSGVISRLKTVVLILQKTSATRQHPLHPRITSKRNQLYSNSASEQ